LIRIRRANAYVVLALCCAVLAIPSLAWAGSGGNSLTPTPTGTPATQPANVTVTASGNGIALNTTASALLRNGLSFYGAASPGDSGQTVEIERLGNQTGWQWAPTVSAVVAPDGSFTATWVTNHIGRFQIRAILTQGTSAAAAMAAPTLTTTIYRPSIATLYGPGFYGRHTACGGRLTRGTIGVANRTLRCGSKVAIDYRGRVVIVPVIDRGPYANNADWDLTMATAKLIGATGTETIGAVSLPRQPAGTPAAGTQPAAPAASSR
jgi:hypothetical protein